jgi:starch phosphorylase
MEFLIGRWLRNNLFNLGIRDTCRDTLRELGVDLHALEEIEPDAALGNGANNVLNGINNSGDI